MNEQNIRNQISRAIDESNQDLCGNPFLAEKIKIGLLPYIQAKLLARFIRGELDLYPPFLIK